jgi:hypothetical protein
MIRKITKLLALACLLNASEPTFPLGQWFATPKVEEPIGSKLRCFQNKKFEDVLALAKYIKKQYEDFVANLCYLHSAKLQAAQNIEQKESIESINNELYIYGKTVQAMDEDVLYVYLALQGIDVGRRDAYGDFIRECTPERIIVFLINIKESWADTLPELKRNFRAGIGKNQALRRKFNQIREEIINNCPDLLDRLNWLFGPAAA